MSFKTFSANQTAVGKIDASKGESPKTGVAADVQTVLRPATGPASTPVAVTAPAKP